MSPKNFKTLAGVATALAIWSIVLAFQSDSVVITFARGRALIDDIDTARLTRIEVSKGDESVVLQRAGVNFRVESKDSYPADGGRINKIIGDCMQIALIREISDTEVSHEILGVDEGVDSTVVRFLDGDQEIVAVVIGNAEGAGNYVRLRGDPTVYLSERSIFLYTDSLDYVDKTLTTIDRLEQVEVSGNGDPYIVAKKDDGITLEGIPEDMVVVGTTHEQVFNAGNNLTFTDFQSESLAGDLDFKHQFVAKTDAGEVYSFQIAEQDDKWYCKVSGEYTGPASLGEAEVMAGKDDPELQAQQAAILGASSRISELNDRHQSWVYEIASLSSGNMTKAFADLIEENKSFLGISTEDVAKVDVTVGESTYTIESPEAGEIGLLGISEDKQAKGSDYELVFSAATSVAWSTRVEPDAEAIQDLEYGDSYKMTLRNGVQYSFALAEKDGKRYLRASAAYVGDGGEEPAAVIAKGVVAKFNERHQAHVYEMGFGAVDNMVKGFDELVVDRNARPESVSASHILVSYAGSAQSTVERTKDEAQKLAEDLYAQALAAPDTFAELASEHSDGPSKTDGGDLGSFAFEAMTPAFSEAAFALEVGAISGVVETEFGFHIIKRTN